jgi:chromosome segregation ATPase
VAYTKEELAKFAAEAAELRSKAQTLQDEQRKLHESGSTNSDRYYLLAVEIKELRAEAAKVYAPVLDAMEEDIKNNS